MSRPHFAEKHNCRHAFLVARLLHFLTLFLQRETMPYLKRKANNPQSAYGSYENPIMIDDGPVGPVFKKVRRQSNAPYPMPGAIPRAAPKMYVNRTPGGTIVAENHYYDNALTATAVYQGANWNGTELDPGATGSLFNPTTGDDIGSRTGRKVFVKKIRVVGEIVIPAQSAKTTQSEAAQIRILVYNDMQTNAAQATGDLVLSQAGGADPIQFGMNLANLGRFKILKDKKWVVTPADFSGLTTAFVAAGRVIPFKFNLKVNQYVNYNATNSPDVSSIVDNSWHLIALSTVNTMAPTIAYHVRTTFSP